MGKLTTGGRSQRIFGTVFRILGIIFLVNITAVIVFLIVSLIPPNYTETTDIEDYGSYTGNRDDEFVQDFVSSFFPNQIQPYFSDVCYSYRAEDEDRYGFEAYLEFTISDEELFEQYIASIADESAWTEFAFDDSYKELIIANGFELTSDKMLQGYDDPTYGIWWAHVGKILFSEETNRIIYVAIGVKDGGFADTGYLCAFFDRFDIGPIEFARSAQSAAEYYETVNN